MSKNMKYSEVRQIVYNRYRGECAICGKNLPVADMCISLIIPKSKGGYKDFSNMQAACECCARMKNDMTQDEFFEKVFKIAESNSIYYRKKGEKKENSAATLFEKRCRT